MIICRKLLGSDLHAFALVLRAGKSGFKQGRVSQAMRPAAHVNHGLMDELNLLASDPPG